MVRDMIEFISSLIRLSTPSYFGHYLLTLKLDSASQIITNNHELGHASRNRERIPTKINLLKISESQCKGNGLADNLRNF